MSRALVLVVMLAGCHSDEKDSPDATGAAPDAIDAPPGFVPSPHRAIPPATHQSTAGTLSPMRLVTVVSQGDPLADQLFAFGDALVVSQWFGAWATDYGIAPPTANLLVTGPAIASGTQLDRAAVVAYLDGAGLPAPDGKTLYMLYLPSGVTLLSLAEEVNTNCRLFGAYHARYHNTGDGFGVAQSCPPKSGETQLDVMTGLASHEIAEGASDTGPGWGIVATPRMTPWTSSVWSEIEGSGNAEIGDLCAGARTDEGGYQYQRIFSNVAAAANSDPCVPAVSDPYFAIDPAQDWTSGAPGTTVTIPLTGWSTAPTTEWAVRPSIVGSSDATLAFTALVSSPTTGTFGTKTLPTINNGGPATLTITIPAGAASGSWVAVQLGSVHLDANGNPPSTGDLRHLSLAGAYVP
jgi:hypothetical protein